ncbi:MULTISPECIES: IS30 family transposase [unclassified Micromonospora]|uniref:IS30 family transposase n=1 Tax=unclassified Micromonospora TaxID=2617518 RepID=UPI0013040DD2|nr:MULTISPECIES: IS30 family transposase [unclassified Micromonospora]MDI5941483.1 IS30 family transposase [Micromonospora sp. DH15]
MAPRLSAGEREEIGLGRAAGESIRSIARRLGRQPSTISREVARFECYGQSYKPAAADWAAWLRHRRARRPARLAVDGPLRGLVIGLLRRRWSPRQIAARLRLDYPDQSELHVSHETIYQAIYLQSRGNLRAELTRQVALRSARAARRARPVAGAAVRSNRAWVGLNISARPAEAADRAVPGHWEGDLIEGGNRAGGSVIATLVERQTRFVILVGLPHGKLSEHVAAQLAAAMGRLPARLRASLTWDQGTEMARHADFTLATDCPVYFCDPHSPWQRGSNENTNGLLRQYFPKGRTDFTKLSQADLDAVADELNTRPRQTLGWATPSERMAQLLGVATTA